MQYLQHIGHNHPAGTQFTSKVSDPHYKNISNRTNLAQKSS